MVPLSEMFDLLLIALQSVLNLCMDNEPRDGRHVFQDLTEGVLDVGRLGEITSDEECNSFTVGARANED